VSLLTLRERIPLVNSALLAAVFFLIPTQVAPVYLLTVMILVLLLLDGGLPAQVRALVRSPMVWAFVAYYAVFVVSLLWTQDAAWGQRMLRKQTFFLLFPVYLLAARREHFRSYVAAFIAGVAMCVMLAWYNWLRLHYLPGLPEGVQVDKGVGDTAPFVDRIMYAPILAFAVYLLLHEWLFRASSGRRRWLLGALTLAVLSNVLMSGGRAGVVGLLALIGLVIMQRFARRPVLAAALAAGSIAAITGAGYTLFPMFEQRVDKVVEYVTDPTAPGDRSLYYRLAYARGALNVFADQPLLGAGAGDLPDEYFRVNPNAPLESGRMWNPHNHYLFILATTGALGGAIFVLVFGTVLRARTHPEDQLKRIQIALVVLFAVICLGESYLARSNTSLLFLLFSALIARSALDLRTLAGAKEPAKPG